MSKDPDAPDTAAFVREMLGQWETIAQEFGTGLLKSGEFARTVNNATAATSKARALGGEVVGRALAAANMPSRDELRRLSQQMEAIEDRLARIETLLEPRPAKVKKAKKDKAKP